MKVLVTAASRHGATAEIAGAIGEGLRRRGLEVAVMAPEYVGSLSGYDAVVLGSAVYDSHWLDPALRLVERAASALRSRPVWLFSSDPVGRPSRKMARAVALDPLELPRISDAVRPRDHRMFVGGPEGRSLPLRQCLALFIVRLLEGDFRNGEAIDAWAAEIAASLGPAPPRR